MIKTITQGIKSVVSFQRQQVVLTQQWAKANPLIHFSVMHPGWVDTSGTDLLRRQAQNYF